MDWFRDDLEYDSLVIDMLLLGFFTSYLQQLLIIVYVFL